MKSKPPENVVLKLTDGIEIFAVTHDYHADDGGYFEADICLNGKPICHIDGCSHCEAIFITPDVDFQLCILKKVSTP
jgi:hypothetical protein